MNMTYTMNIVKILDIILSFNQMFAVCFSFIFSVQYSLKVAQHIKPKYVSVVLLFDCNA